MITEYDYEIKIEYGDESTFRTIQRFLTRCKHTYSQIKEPIAEVIPTAISTSEIELAILAIAGIRTQATPIMDHNGFMAQPSFPENNIVY